MEKKILTKEELKACYPKLPKYFKLKNWLSAYIFLLLLANIVGFSTFIWFSDVSGYFIALVSTFLSLPFSMLITINPNVNLPMPFDKWFGIRSVKKELDEWNGLYYEYSKHQKYLELKKQYEN